MLSKTQGSGAFPSLGRGEWVAVQKGSCAVGRGSLARECWMGTAARAAPCLLPGGLRASAQRSLLPLAALLARQRLSISPSLPGSSCRSPIPVLCTPFSGSEPRGGHRRSLSVAAGQVRSRQRPQCPDPTPGRCALRLRLQSPGVRAFDISGASSRSCWMESKAKGKAEGLLWERDSQREER